MVTSFRRSQLDRNQRHTDWRRFERRSSGETGQKNIDEKLTELYRESFPLD